MGKGPGHRSVGMQEEKAEEAEEVLGCT